MGGTKNRKIHLGVRSKPMVLEPPTYETSNGYINPVQSFQSHSSPSSWDYHGNIMAIFPRETWHTLIYHDMNKNLMLGSAPMETCLLPTSVLGELMVKVCTSF